MGVCDSAFSENIIRNRAHAHPHHLKLASSPKANSLNEDVTARDRNHSEVKDIRWRIKGRLSIDATLVEQRTGE
jgi:hypothetical protein